MLTNESRQVTFTDVRGWRERRGRGWVKRGRVSVSSYRFICKILLAWSEATAVRKGMDRQSWRRRHTGALFYFLGPNSDSWNISLICEPRILVTTLAMMKMSVSGNIFSLDRTQKKQKHLWCFRHLTATELRNQAQHFKNRIANHIFWIFWLWGLPQSPMCDLISLGYWRMFLSNCKTQQSEADWLQEKSEEKSLWLNSFFRMTDAVHTKKENWVGRKYAKHRGLEFQHASARKGRRSLFATTFRKLKVHHPSKASLLNKCMIL